MEPGRAWIGGVYYVRNVLKTLSYAPWIGDCSVHVLVRPDFRELFESLASDFLSYTLHERSIVKPWRERLASLLLKPFGYIQDFQISEVSNRIGADVIFPLGSYPFANVRGCQVHWIPDFQHLHLPKYFPKQELRRRGHQHRAIARRERPLVLSSRSARDDWERIAPRHRGKVFVLPFISDIESEISALSPEIERRLLDEVGLLDGEAALPYFYIPNQFWQHKNHQVVLDALDCLKSRGRLLPTIVCTGSVSDHRSKEHASRLLSRIEASGLTDHFRILSMVDRPLQLTIMKHARAVLQPSLFEGWNTGVQEALRLGRPLLMSDLPVHREQCPEGARFFDPLSAPELADHLENPPEAIELDGETLRNRNAKTARHFADGVKELLVP